jgi:hypothetical protein
MFEGIVMRLLCRVVATHTTAVGAALPAGVGASAGHDALCNMLLYSQRIGVLLLLFVLPPGAQELQPGCCAAV